MRGTDQDVKGGVGVGQGGPSFASGGNLFDIDDQCSGQICPDFVATCSWRQMHLPHATFSHVQSLHGTDDMCSLAQGA